MLRAGRQAPLTWFTALGFLLSSGGERLGFWFGSQASVPAFVVPQEVVGVWCPWGHVRLQEEWGGGSSLRLRLGHYSHNHLKVTEKNWQEGGKTARLCWAFFQHGLGSGGLY